MLTYSFEHRGADSLYEYLYKQIKDDIMKGRLKPDEKLPSKRSLAKNLNISVITVENAYSQLVAEGYIYTVPKSGFYVSHVSSTRVKTDKRPVMEEKTENPEEPCFADFVGNSSGREIFPFSTWNKLMRETMTEDADKLMVRSPSAGVWKLRKAIADYLYQYRGMEVEPEQIIVGAGTEYLYGLIIQLLGRNKNYALEDPGYRKISSIYQANNVTCIYVPLDKHGIDVQYLENENADILHISPSHHFPTGMVTPIRRRYELLSWAQKSESRYIIEDDYDSEFRLLGKPIPSMQSIDESGKVIYINTFSKSLTSTIRISYMVLPKELLKTYKEKLSFYSCTVSNFEQYALARFIEKGYLEKHINRTRNYYRNLRDNILECIRSHPRYNSTRIREENAGLHFLLDVETNLSDGKLVTKAKEQGINISCLSQYYFNKKRVKQHTIIINYSGIKPESVEVAVKKLMELF